MASTTTLMKRSFQAGRRAPRSRRARRSGTGIAGVKGGVGTFVASPYLRALMRDRVLRSELEDAYGSLARAYGRASKKDLGADLLEDRRARKELGKASSSLRAASQRLGAAKSGHRRGRRGRIVLLVAVAGGVGALALSEELRGRLMGLVSGNDGSPSDASSNGTSRTAAPRDGAAPEGATTV
jgi:hypothetical protein